MATVGVNNISQIYKNEYSSWRENKNLQAAKRQEYLRRNPDSIKDYDLQRAKILLNAVDMMDKSVSEKSNKTSVAIESMTNLGLGYAAVGGAALGFLLTKLKFVKNGIDKIVQKVPKSKNIISMGITAISGVLGILAVYPAYNFLSKIESKIHRKRKFDTMENELNDPKIFVVLDEKQKEIYNKNLQDIEKNKIANKTNFAKKEIKNIEQMVKEAWYYDQEQSKFKEKYKEDKSLYEKSLNEKDIKDAKKDKALLLTMMREVNLRAQSYSEKMQRITDNAITLSFALGSLFALGYERLASKLKIKSSLPAGLGVILLIGSTFFATWAQRRASHVGRFMAKRDLMQNPEQLVYISKRKTDTIDDEEIKIEEHKSPGTIKFLRDFFKNNKEYQKWKNTPALTGEDISKAMENIDISPEQLADGKRLQKNLFKTLYKIDKNTQNYSGDIQVLSESVKYPLDLTLGTIGSIWGLKHLAKIRGAKNSSEVFKHTVRYVGTVSLFTIPLLLLNAYFAKAQKMGARISDMATMKDMEDYRFFADYSNEVEKMNS